jgi:hypothetical protein
MEADSEVYVTDLCRRAGLDRTGEAGVLWGVDRPRTRSENQRALHKCVTAATGGHSHQHSRSVTDGPFAETREQLGGFFLIEAENLDEAIAVAGRVPGARKGTVEIRPVVELPDLPTD